MDFSMFANVKAPSPACNITMKEFIQAHVGSRWDKYKAQIDEIRNFDKEADPEGYRKLKAKLPIGTPSGTFSRRNKEGLIKHSGFLCVDVDVKKPNKENPEGVNLHLLEEKALQAFLEKIKKEPWVYGICRSVGGEGVILFVKIAPAIESHLNYFLEIEAYILEHYQVTIDPSCKDVCRPRYISHDPDFYLNEEASQYVLTNRSFDFTDNIKEKPIEKVTGTESVNWNRIEKIVKAAETQKIVLGIDNHDTWVKRAFALAEEFGESGRDFFHRLCKQSKKYKYDVKEKRECNRQYDRCLNAKGSGSKIKIGSLFQFAINSGWDEKTNTFREKTAADTTDATNDTTNTSDVSPEKEPYDENETLFPPIPFPYKSVPEYWRKISKEMADAIGVDQLSVATMMFPVIGGMLGNKVTVSSQPGYQLSLFIWLIGVAVSGGGKSPVTNLLMNPLCKKQMDNDFIYKMEMNGYAYKNAIYNKSLKKANEGDYVEGRTFPSPPEEPLLKASFVTDTTTEGLGDACRATPEGLVLYMDEISALMGGLNKYRGGKGNDREFFLLFFDNKPIRIVRKGCQITIQNPGGSIMGSIQTGKLQRVFSDRDIEDGFLPRFLPYIVKDEILTWNKAGFSAETAKQYEDILFACGKVPLVLNKGGGVVSTELVLGPEANKVYSDYRIECEKKYEFLTVNARPFVKKYNAYSLKIAAILHVLDYLEKTGAYDSNASEIPIKETEINAETMERAVEITKFFFGQIMQVLKLFKSQKELDPDLKALIESVLELEGEVVGGFLSYDRILKVLNEKLPDEMKLKDNQELGYLVKNKLKMKKKTKGTKNRTHLIWNIEKIATWKKEINKYSNDKSEKAENTKGNKGNKGFSKGDFVENEGKTKGTEDTEHFSKDDFAENTESDDDLPPILRKNHDK